MIHARRDYNRIQDPAGLIGGDEPVFLVRAKDKLFYRTLMFWASDLERCGGDPETVEAVRTHARRGTEWAEENGCKVPDTPIEEIAIHVEGRGVVTPLGRKLTGD